MTTVEQLNAWMAEPREGRLEFKEAKTQYDSTKLMRYCVALANENGGKFILGVTDKLPRRVVGSQAFPNLTDVQGKILQKLGFRVEAEEVTHPDGRVVVFHIPPRPRGTAYQHEGAYLMRAGDELVPMSEDRLRAIFDEGKPSWLSQIARSNVSADDVVRLLDTQSYFDLMKLGYPARREEVLKRFISEKFIHPRHSQFEITNIGAILFAKDLQEFDGLARKSPRVIVYDGNSKLTTKSDKIGNRGYAVGFEGLVEYVNGQLPSNEVIGKALRETVKMYPEIAVRELVANALIHQDFNETGTSVVVEVYSDRIEIASPGKPLIQTERFIDEYQSRNEKLADLMRRLRICEEKGSGIDKVFQSVERYQLPPPDFRAGEKHTVAVMFCHQDFEEMGRKDRIRACYQHCGLRYVMNQKMTNQSLRERFNLSEDRVATVSQIIADTVEAGLISLDDPTNTSRRYAQYVPFWG